MLHLGEKKLVKARGKVEHLGRGQCNQWKPGRVGPCHWEGQRVCCHRHEGQLSRLKASLRGACDEACQRRKKRLVTVLRMDSSEARWETTIGERAMLRQGASQAESLFQAKERLPMLTRLLYGDLEDAKRRAS